MNRGADPRQGAVAAPAVPRASGLERRSVPFGAATDGNLLASPRAQAGMPVATPQVAGVVGVAVLVAGALAVRRPPVTRETVLAAVPWMAVGALLQTLGGLGVYPAALAPAVAPPQVHVAALALGGLAWLPSLQLAALRGREANTPGHLAASGVGALVVLLWLVGVHAQFDAQGLLWLVLTPILAAVVAGVGYFLLGLADAAPLAYTRLAGLVVVFAHVFDALAVTVAVDVLGRSAGGPLATATSDLLAAVAPALFVGAVVVPVRLLGALVAVWALAEFTHSSPTRGHVALGTLAALGLGPGLARLLALAVG